MLMGKYRAYILWSVLAFVIIAGVIWIKAPANFLTASREALGNIFGRQEQFVEVVDTQNEQTLPEAGEARVISALSKPKNTLVTNVSGPDNPREAVNLRVERVVYDVEGADEGKERIVIKNYSTLPVNISNFSVQYLKSGGEYSSISKKNFESGDRIESNGEFVVGVNCKGAMPCSGVDMSWSQALGNDGGTIYLVSNQENILGVGDLDIVSFLKY